MFETEAHRRRGMTLTELLVVIAILGLLMVTAIPVLVPNDERAGREAALTFTSAIARAKKRAARKKDLAGITLAAIQDDVAAPNAMRLKAADLFVCEQRNPYPTGSGARANVYEVVSDPNGANTPLNPREFRILIDRSSDSPDLRYLFPVATHHICYLGGDDDRLYVFDWLTHSTVPTSNNLNNYPLDYLAVSGSCPPAGADGGTTESWLGRIRPLSRLGSVSTTSKDGVWKWDQPDPPSPDWSSRISFVAPLTKSASPPLTLPGSIVVDLTWSCLNGQLFCHSPHVDGTHDPLFFEPNGAVLSGSEQMQCLPNFSAFYDVSKSFARDPGEAMQSVHVVFTASGEVKRVEYPRDDGSGLYYYQQDLVPGDVLYFLLGRADRAGNGWVAEPQTTPGANWQYGDSRWVSIQQSGTVTISNTRIDAQTVDVAMEDAIAGIRSSRY